MRGWLPIAGDPTAPGPDFHERAVPWPAWPGAETRAGSATVESTSPFRVEERAGVARVDAQPTAFDDDGASARFARVTLRVDDPAGLGLIRWSGSSARVDVSAKSRLIVHPGSAEWRASVEYDVEGGPSETMRLRVPTAWASAAKLEADEGDPVITSRAEGETTLFTIEPVRPVWGRFRVRIKADRPIRRGEVVAFPDVAPMGRGVVETHLALIDASGWSIQPEGTRGLQPLPMGRFPAGAEPLDPLTATEVFLVKRDGWSLRFRAGEGRAGEIEGQASATSAEIDAVLDGAGGIAGAAEYRLEAPAGPFFAVAPPANVEGASALVDGRPAPILVGDDGRWLVPTGSPARESKVSVYWKGRAGTDRTLALPATGRGRLPTFVTIHAPETVAIEPAATGMKLLGAIDARVERLEAESGRLSASLPQVDRSDPRARDALASAVSRFEGQAREVERAVRSASTDDEAGGGPLFARAAVARSSLVEALLAAGLEDATKGAVADARPADEAPHLRTWGVPHHFRAEGKGDPGSLRIKARAVVAAGGASSADFGLITLATVFGLLLIPIGPGPRPPWRNAGATLLAIASPAVGAPAIAACGFAAIVGHRVRGGPADVTGDRDRCVLKGAPVPAFPKTTARRASAGGSF